jgi:hypothetical protein
MPFDDDLYYLGGEREEVVFCARLGGDEGVEFGGGRSCGRV